MRTVETFDWTLPWMSTSIGPGMTAAATGVTIGSDAEAVGTAVAALAEIGPPANATGAAAATITAAPANSAAPRAGVGSRMTSLFLLWASRWTVPRASTCRRSTFAPPYLGLKRPAMNCSSGSATGFRRRVLSAAREAAGPWECETCLLYTSDAADDLLCVDLGG